MANTQKLIAVVGASGQQGGAVVRALQASGQFKVRALTRTPAVEVAGHGKVFHATGNQQHDRNGRDRLGL